MQFSHLDDETMASADVGHLIKEGDKAVLKRGDSILVVDVTKRK